MKKSLMFVGLFLILSLSVFVSAEETYCTDSDGGNNPNLAGIATTQEKGQTDYCYFNDGEENVLKEAICEGDEVKLLTVTCSDDKPYCNKAVCSDVRPTCTDTDGGNDPLVKGTITESRNEDGPSGSDYCESVSNNQITYVEEGCSGDDCGLREFYCVSNIISSSVDVKCPDGCSDGVCIGEVLIPSDEPEDFPEIGQCADSDGGKNYYIKGEIEGPLAASPNSPREDICAGGSVRELFCNSEGKGEPFLYECPDGCSEGVCISYIIQSDFGSIIYEGIEKGATADTIDFLSTLFPDFVDGAFARYYIGGQIDNKDLSISVAEFEDEISFDEFEENYVNLFREESPSTILDYDGAIEGEDRALMLSTETTSILRDGSKKTEISIIWISETKFILIYIGDKSSVWTESENGGISTSRDFLNLLKTYQRKFPSTLVPPRGETPEEKRDDICNFGCKIENSCVNVGYRTSDKYCALGNEFLLQVGDGEQCNNSFECGSNVCVSGQCIEAGLIQKILNWFRNLFG